MGDKYNLKIPQKLVSFLKGYIERHEELGFEFVSQFVLHIIQEEVKKLLKEEEEFKRDKKAITLKSGTYSKEELQKILRNMEEE